MDAFSRQFGHLGAVQMRVNGLVAELHMPEALVSQFHPQTGEELDQWLPPGNPQPAFNLDDYDAVCPANWMRGDARSASYFVRVVPGRGLWLNFNGNAHHTHHVAALISVQGLNAVSGRKATGFSLEQYRERCPKHQVLFGAERFCKECGYKWPPQNYLATTGTFAGYFWFDGFRAADGCVRQWVVTEEEMRGVAAQVLGQDRVFAIGVAFFLSTQPKPPPPRFEPSARRTNFGWDESGLTLGGSGLKGGPPLTYGAYEEEADEVCAFAGEVEAVEEECNPAEVGGDEDEGEPGAAPAARRASSRGVAAVRRTVAAAAVGARQAAPRAPVAPKKKLEVAAGARIDQDVYFDPSPTDFWQEEPAGVIYVNYVDEATAREILAHEKPDRTRRGEGWMDGLEVGHQPGVKPA